MAEKIQVWALKGGTGQTLAEPLQELRSTETEQRLEELLVNSPEVLMPDLTLVGRQVQTAGGPLDLLGIDRDGRLVLFELKRGTLTRDAVAQILDYGSELTEREPEDLAGLIEQNSGRLGIERIEDFADWYRSEFPDVEELPPAGMRLVLVGLGADDRARRMVGYLAKSGLDVQLLTFQAFRERDSIFLARSMEGGDKGGTDDRAAGGTKAGNRKILEEFAERHGVKALLLEVADFVEEKIEGYRWPGKQGFSYSLQEMTEHGRPSLRAYAWLGIGSEPARRIVLQLPARSVDVAPAAVEEAARLPGVRRNVNSWNRFELPISRETWPSIKEPVAMLLSAIHSGWKAKAEAAKEPDAPTPE